jgi:hypothetical protein
VQSSSSLSWAQAGTLGELVNAAAEALDAGGERAKLERSVYWAAVFLSQLPLSASPPDVSIEDSGSVTFDWDRGARRVFAVRFSSDENLHYAGLFGTEAIHGSEPASQVTPLAILKGIERVVSEARHYSNPE